MTAHKGKIIIAGAGLGGLTAANCLLLAGYDVEVYEQAPALGEIGAGIQQSANAMHVMRHIGVLDKIATHAVRPPVTQFRIFNTGEVLQELALADMHEKRFGAPYYQLHRADLHKVLADRVEDLKAGAVHLNATAVGFEETPEGVSLRLADGTKISGDVLIGADGIKSAIRRQIAGDSKPEYTGDAAWRLTVPTERLPDGIMDGKSSIWVGPGKHAVIYFLRSGSLLNCVTAVECDEWTDETWTERKPWADLKRDLVGWHDEIQMIVDATDKDQCFRWALNVHQPIDNWSTDRATLLGDACHPTLPYLAQGAVMAIEDAAVLTRSLDQAGTIADALQLYQANRIERTARIVRESHRNRTLFHLESIDELKQEFAKRNMDQERADWLYSYNPMTVDLIEPPRGGIAAQ